MIRSTDWDLADIWYATSEDGFHWKEQGPAVTRLARGQLGWRSNCTPDILIRKGKHHLYCQAYGKVIEGGDSCPVTMAEAESPDGPWLALGRPFSNPGRPMTGTAPAPTTRSHSYTEARLPFIVKDRRANDAAVITSSEPKV